MYGFKNIKKQILFKRYGPCNRLREDTATRSFGEITLYPNFWDVRGAKLQNILDNWTVFQELEDGNLKGREDLKV